MRAIFPGTFDPPTLGHLDIINRSAALFDSLYVAVGRNSNKEHAVFSLSERIVLLKKITGSLQNVEIGFYDGLLVDYAKQIDVSLVIKAVRNGSDVDVEMIQASMNRKLSGVETFLMMADEKYRLTSSSLVREVARQGHRLHLFVPEEIEEMVFQRLSNKNEL